MVDKFLKRSLYYLKLFLAFSALEWKRATIHRIGIILFITAKLVRFFTLLFLLFAVIKPGESIAGYTSMQVIFIYLSFNFIDTISQALFREVYRARSYIISGGLDSILIKPYNALFHLLLSGIDFFDIAVLSVYLVFLIVIGGKVETSALRVFIYVFLVFNSVAMNAAVHILVLALTVATAQTDQLILIWRNIFGFGRFPVEIYGKLLSLFLTFVIPVFLMVELPASSLFRAADLSLIAVALVYSSVMLSISLYLWNFSLKKYQSWGG